MIADCKLMEACLKFDCGVPDDSFWINENQEPQYSLSYEERNRKLLDFAWPLNVLARSVGARRSRAGVGGRDRPSSLSSVVCKDDLLWDHGSKRNEPNGGRFAPWRVSRGEAG